MKNKVLAVTRGSIPYLKALRPIAKSVTSCILMQQLDFWFDGYPDGFYKFLEPSPSVPGYKKGDSWVEELAFSPEEFKTAFLNIGVAYKSKTEFEKAENKFLSKEKDKEGKEDKKEKFYCSYYDRQTRKTFYLRNHNLVDQILSEIIERPSKKRFGKDFPETDNPGFLETEGSNPRNRQSRFLETDNPGLQKPTIPVSPHDHDLHEITTEITTEITGEVEHSLDTLPPDPIPINFSPPEEEKLKPDLEVIPKPETNQQALVYAFAALKRLNLKLYKGGYSRLAREIKDFTALGVTVQQVENFSRYWYSQDFRGIKGEPPTFAQVSELWETAALWIQLNTTIYPEPKDGGFPVVVNVQPQKPKQLTNKAQETQQMIDDNW